MAIIILEQAENVPAPEEEQAENIGRDRNTGRNPALWLILLISSLLSFTIAIYLLCRKT